MEIIGLIVLLMTAGAVAGITAGLFGNGGGFAIVPALVAVGTSLACIIFSSARAMFAHHQKGAVDFQVIKTWAPWLILGCCFGTYIASFTDAKGLYLIFAWGVLLYGIYFLYPQNLYYNNNTFLLCCQVKNINFLHFFQVLRLTRF